MPRLTDRKLSAGPLARRILAEVWNHPNNRDHRVRAVTRTLAWQIRKRVGKPHQRTVYGSMRILMDPEAGSASNIVYFGERFDLDEMTFLDRYLRPGDRFLDVGANIGTYTLYVATLVAPGGTIDTFEAVPGLAAKLRANIALNPGLDEVVTVHEVAVSDHVGEIRFRVDRDVSSRMATERDPDSTVAVVPCGPLDDLIADGPVALAKIDVEGAELMALDGFARHLAAADPPVLLLEVLPGQLARLGATVEEVVALLDGAGYDLATFSAATGEVTWLDGASVRGNLLAVARARRDEVLARLGPPRPT